MSHIEVPEKLVGVFKVAAEEHAGGGLVVDWAGAFLDVGSGLGFVEGQAASGAGEFIGWVGEYDCGHFRLSLTFSDR